MPRALPRWSALLLTLPCIACTQVPVDEPRSEATEASKPAITSSKPEAAPATAGGMATFARASNAFAADLYAELGATPGNVFFSPASLSTALSMTWLGARGATRDEMTKVLHFGDDDATGSAARVLASLNDASRTSYTLSVVSRLFGEQSYGFDQGFLDVTRRDFGAELVKSDFRGAAEPARVAINDWVAGATHDRIVNLVPQGAIDGLTRLVLVNAIHMKADWATPFKKSSTRDDVFHLTATDRVDVPTMHGALHAPLGEVDGVRILDLPYASGDLSMTILMPTDEAALPGLEAKVAGGGLDALVAKLDTKHVAVSLPKFKIAPAEPLALAGTLSRMGMPLAFSEEAADFTGMSQPGEARLFISKVFHKAFVAVDEAGTEAAAASAVIMSKQSMPAPPTDAFVADHPFLFTIRDRASGTILFMGRLVDPR